MYAQRIVLARKGDIQAAIGLMRDCAVALRDQTHDGRNNLAGLCAIYLADALDRLSSTDSTAALFCLEMPSNRPASNDASVHVSRSRKILKAFQTGLTLTAAISSVALEEHKSDSAIRASFRKGAMQAEVELLIRTPKDRRAEIKLP